MVRVRSLEEGYKTQQSQTLKDDDGEDWVAPAGSSGMPAQAFDKISLTRAIASGSVVGEIPDIAKLNITNPPPSTTTTTTTTTATTDDDGDDDDGETGEIPDMDSFEVDDNLVEDDQVR